MQGEEGCREGGRLRGSLGTHIHSLYDIGELAGHSNLIHMHLQHSFALGLELRLDPSRME